MAPFEDFKPGDRVLICGKHPWSGERGQVVCAQEVPLIHTVGLHVALDNGTGCYVFERREVMREKGLDSLLRHGGCKR
jgi:hypothetical protein